MDRARESSRATNSGSGRSNASGRPETLRARAAGWLELERALRVVYGGVMAELKPLGVVGMATFDPMAGFVLWREQRAAARDRARTTRELYPNEAKSAPMCPGEKELGELALAVRYAVGAYGTAASMVGDASFGDKLKSLKLNARSGSMSGDHYERMHAQATEACAKSCGIDVRDIVDAEWRGTEFSPSSFVAVDRREKRVILSIRGTWEIHDALTDVSSSSVKFLNGWAHSGIVASAWQVVKRMLPAAAAALVERSDFEFMVTGHSLGGGVAACVTMLMHSEDRDLELLAMRNLEGVDESAREDVLRRMAECRCVCIASPSVSSMNLSEAASDYITCVVAGADVIPRVCHASVRRLLRRLNHAAPSHAMLRAMSSALGGRDRPANPTRRHVEDDEREDDDDASARANRNSEANDGPRPRAHEDVRGAHSATSSPSKTRPVEDERKCQDSWGDVEGVVGLELRDHSASDFMVQPGRVIHLEHVRSSAPTATYKHPTAFTDILLDPYMMLDHIPGNYQAAVRTIHDRVKSGGSAWVKHDPVDDDSGDENDEEAANVFVHAEDVRLSAQRGWRSVRNFLGMDDDSDDAHDDDRSARPSNDPIPSSHAAQSPTFSSSSSDSDVPDYYGEAERRVRRPRDVPKPSTVVRDAVAVHAENDDDDDENNPFAKAWNWLNRRARE